MTDDVDPVFEPHVQAQPEPVQPRADLADLYVGIDRRARPGRRAAATLAVGLALGLLGGYALGRAVGTTGEGASVQTWGGTSDDATLIEVAPSNGTGGLSGLDYVGPPLDLLGTRTTAQGIELVVRAGAVAEGAQSCAPDRVVRVGVVANDALIGVVLANTYPNDGAPAGLLRLTGLAEGRPVLVGIIRASDGQVSARFPDGTLDSAPVQGGVAVVAAFGGPGQNPQELLASTIEIVEAPAGTPSSIDGTVAPPTCDQPVSPTVPVPPVDDKPPLPQAGEQPVEPSTAEDQVRAAYLGAFDSTNSEDQKAAFIERSDIWREAGRRFADSPYGNTVYDLQAEVDAVVFTDPTHASVRYQLIATDDRVPRFQIGDAVLVNGTWLVAITTPCDLLSLAGIQCNMSL